MLNPRSNKKRSTPGRNSRGKSMEQELPLDGIYANYNFLHSVGMLVGLPVQLLTKNKELYEGVLTTFGPNFEVVLDWPHLVSCENSSVISNLESVKRKLIFKAHDIVLIRVANVDLDFATRENFATDSDISKFNGLPSTGRELEPWLEECSTMENMDLNDNNANGWDADDMFRKNEEKYGVTTTYSPNMEGYTTPLQKKNTPEWKAQEARAQKIASEIERSSMTISRAEMENGDEEDKYSAVTRPVVDGQSTGKYMPPQRRKHGESLPGKPPRSINALPSQGPPNQGPPHPTGRYNTQQQMPPHRYGEGGHHSLPSYPPYNQQQGQGHMKPHSTLPATSASVVHKNAMPSQPSCPGPPASGSQPPVSHSFQRDARINGEAKGDTRRSTGDDSASNASRESSIHKDSFSNESFTKQPPPSLHHHNPPTAHIHGHESISSTRKPLNPDKDPHLASFKSFGRDFKLGEGVIDKKGPPQVPFQRGLGGPHPSSHQPVHPAATTNSSGGNNGGHSSNPVVLTPGGAEPDGPGRVSANTTAPSSGVVPPPPDVTAAASSGPPPPATTSAVATPTGASPPVDGSGASSKATAAAASVTSSKLNPNAKEFVFNPNAKPFNPKFPSTSTPPRAQTPQIAAPSGATQQLPPAGGGLTAAAVGGYPQNMVHAYVMAPQPFQVQSQPRLQKRATTVSNPRPDYVSSMQVAAATGTPILASTPLTPITAPQSQALHRVPIPHNMMQHNPQPYQCQGVPMMLPFPPHGIPMVTTMVPTSMGMYYQGAEGLQPQHNQPPGHHAAQQTMYVAAAPPPQSQQPQHHSGNVGGIPHPGQPPTPQNHGGSNSASAHPPQQPPTPGPTPPQAMIYGASPSMPSQPLPPPSGQVPHNPYSGHNVPAAIAAAAAAHHHAPPPGGAQLVMIPQHMTPHVMGHSGNAPPPSSAAPFTSTSGPGALQPHMNPGHHVQYIQGGCERPPVIPIIHSNP